MRGSDEEGLQGLEGDDPITEGLGVGHAAGKDIGPSLDFPVWAKEFLAKFAHEFSEGELPEGLADPIGAEPIAYTLVEEAAEDKGNNFLGRDVLRSGII